jgi:dolichyl-phosphate beta-glucosyltransferase
MLALEYVVPIVVTVAVTAGVTWIFYPAWLAAIADGLEWQESELSNPNTSRPTLPVQPSILLSLVIPAYNEQDRIPIMLQDAHQYLVSPKGKALIRKLQACLALSAGDADANANAKGAEDIEWLVVNDGSKDDTCRVVQSTFEALESNHAWKLVSLKANSGKGAAVKTGMLCAKGHFRLMVDADGATDFGPGLERLVEQLLATMELSNGPEKDMITIFGSRAHLQEQSTTQRSFVRTLLMRAFHVFVSVLVSSRIHDTQCGFKMFTKNAALVTFESLHLHRWAFDTEVVLVSDHQSIQIVEVGVPWHEVDGSKLNTSKWALAVVSINMLRDMICVRACYALRIWKVAPRR